MLNWIWLGLIVFAVVVGGLTGNLKALNEAAIDSAKTAVITLALPLAGIMTLWLGLMRLAERSGLVQMLALLLRPVLRWLFPDVPASHPAMGAMVMNFAANMLGLSNAATPLGLRAMKHLESLNPHPGTATNAMCTFLAINTSSLQLIPVSTIAILASAGSQNPTAIVGTALMATSISTVTGITAVKLLQGLRWFAPPSVTDPLTNRSTPIDAEKADEGPKDTPLKLALTCLVLVAFASFAVWVGWSVFRTAPSNEPRFAVAINTLSLMAIPFLILFFPLFAAIRGVKVYEEFVEGAKEGFETAIRIVPYLVAMLVAAGMFRAAGGMDLVAQALRPVLELLNYPAELVPLSLMRPLSGSGANGLFAELVKTHGPDHLLSRMAGTLIGSTETTFYVIAVYFGAAGIHRVRHGLAAGLIADAAGMLAAVMVCRAVFA
ncbi:MAG: nucleoside recognition protein [Verrucomicrobia bacterium]|nr:nucleoside recognition protein [Verrucomicrobiota bacterium]